MTKKSIFLIFITLIIKINGFRQVDKIPKDTIVSRFLKGNMIILNDWVLLGPQDFFDSIKISEDLYQVKLLKTDSAISKYGDYFGDKVRIYELSIPGIDSFSYGYFIDKKIFKYLDPKNEIYFFINGAPCSNCPNALEMFLNKKIIEIQELGANQDTAVWPLKKGKNGALILRTANEPKTLIIFK